MLIDGHTLANFGLTKAKIKEHKRNLLGVTQIWKRERKQEGDEKEIVCPSVHSFHPHSGAGTV